MGVLRPDGDPVLAAGLPVALDDFRGREAASNDPDHLASGHTSISTKRSCPLSFLPYPQMDLVAVEARLDDPRHRRLGKPAARAARARRRRRRAPIPRARPTPRPGGPSTSASTCSQASFASSPPPVATTDSSVADRVEHVGEPVADAFERGLRDVERRGREGQPADRAPALRVPAERALAAEERQEGQPVAGGGTVGDLRGVDVVQRAAQPRVQVAAVGERAAFAEARGVEAVEKEAGLRRERRRS